MAAERQVLLKVSVALKTRISEKLRHVSKFANFSKNKAQLTSKLRISSPNQSPKEQFKGHLVSVEMLGPIHIIGAVNVNHTQSERNVDDDKNQEEDQDVQDHVRHANDDRTRRPPHQSSLNWSQKRQQSCKTPNGSCNEGRFVPFVRTIDSALAIDKRDAPQNEGNEKNYVGGEYVEIFEREPPSEYSGFFITVAIQSEKRLELWNLYNITRILATTKRFCKW